MTTSAMKKVLIFAVLGFAGIAVLYRLTPEVNHYEAIPGRPLLESDGRLFTEEQLGFQFTPPPGWAMQSRSTEAPTNHRTERTVVKFKRLVRGPKVAFLRVTISDVKGDPGPVELLKTRKPREADWKITKGIEDGLTVAGRPAARITFGGAMEPDSGGERPSSCEVTAVRLGGQALYFSGTFANADKEAQKQLRDAVDSLVLDRAKFAKE